jgi:hypothetical protein
LMLALAIEFSRCSRARTPRAEQCARPARPIPTARPEGAGSVREAASPTE